MQRMFVTGIGTGVGKTIVSAIITEALHADYWKPVQTGSGEGTDSETVRSLLTNKDSVIHPEAYSLKLPASPHAAAAEEGIIIQMRNLKAPSTKNMLVIEGAGGLMVPLNDKELMIDLVQHFNAVVVLVVRHYLGSINHTLLSLQALKQKGIKVIGIVYSGNPNEQSEKAIESFSHCPVVGRVSEEKAFSPSVILRYAKEFQQSMLAEVVVKKK